MAADGGLSVEGIAVAYGAHCAEWMGGGHRQASAAEAGFATRRMERYGLALLLWSAGRDEAGVRRDAEAILRADAAAIQAQERRLAPARSRPWPQGRGRALAWLALQELRPELHAEGISTAVRLALLAEGEGGPRLRLARQVWERLWAGRYAALLERAQGRVGAALVGVRENRG